MAQPMQLVHERVTNACIANYQPGLPDQDSDLCVIDPVVSPVYLVAAEGHPFDRAFESEGPRS